MQCAKHSDQAASGLCTRCDAPLCDGCSVERRGRIFCQPCADFVDQRSARPATETVSAPVAPSPPDQPNGGLYQGPVAEPLPAPSAASQPAAPTTDVYQGPPPGDLYEGPVAGEGGAPPASTPPPAASVAASSGLYEGPESSSPAPAIGGSGGAAVAASSAGGEGLPLRGLLYGALAALGTALLWYGISMGTGWKLRWAAMLVGWIVGVATTVGFGRKGSEAALLALGLALVSMIGGEYLVWDHWQKELAKEGDEYAEMIQSVAGHGFITNRDLEIYYDWHNADYPAEELDGEVDAELEGWGQDFEELSPTDLRELRKQAEDDYESFLAYEQDDYKPGFGDFFRQSFLGFHVIFFGVGAMAAFRMAAD